MNYDILTLMTPPSKMQEGFFSGEKEDAARAAGDEAVAKAKAERDTAIKDAKAADKQAKADSKAAAKAQKEQVKAIRLKMETAMKNFNTYYKTANLGKYGKDVQKLSSKVYSNYKKMLTIIAIVTIVVLAGVLGGAAIMKLIKAGAKAKTDPAGALQDLDALDPSKGATTEKLETGAGDNPVAEDVTGDPTVASDPAAATDVASTGVADPTASTADPAAVADTTATDPVATAADPTAPATAAVAGTGIVGASEKVATEVAKTPAEMNDAELVKARDNEPNVAKRKALQDEINKRNTDGQEHFWQADDAKLQADRKKYAAEEAAKLAASQKAPEPAAPTTPEPVAPTAPVTPEADPTVGNPDEALLQTPTNPADNLDKYDNNVKNLQYNRSFQADMNDGLDDRDINKYKAMGYSEDEIRTAVASHNKSVSNNPSFTWQDNSTSPEQRAAQEAAAAKAQAQKDAFAAKNQQRTDAANARKAATANGVLNQMYSGAYGTGLAAKRYQALMNYVGKDITKADLGELTTNGTFPAGRAGVTQLQYLVNQINQRLGEAGKAERINIDFSR